jgi:hypothetical protein
MIRFRHGRSRGCGRRMSSNSESVNRLIESRKIAGAQVDSQDFLRWSGRRKQG